MRLTRNGKKCVGKLYSLTEALGRSAELPVNSDQVCQLHWDEIRHQNIQCSCSIQIILKRVFTKSTPNENEQHNQQKLETGNGRSERMCRRFAAVLYFILRLQRGLPMRQSIQKFNIPPPPATPWAFELLKIGLFKFPPLGAKKPFKCPTN